VAAIAIVDANERADGGDDKSFDQVAVAPFSLNYLFTVSFLGLFIFN